MSPTRRRIAVSGAELTSFLRSDALDLCDEAGLEVRIDLAARDQAADVSAIADAVCRRLHAGRASTELLQRMAGLGELGAALLHEVRNILTGVRGFGQVALRRPDGDARIHLETITRETERAIELLSRYLDLARSGEERGLPIASRDLIESTTILVRHRFYMARVGLVVDRGPDAQLVGGKQELQQVLLNLLINALQASPEAGVVHIGATLVGGGPATAETAARSAAFLDIAVSDQGPGIAPEHRPRLFEPFFTTKPAGQGVGLGLSVSRGIVERHGGAIAVDSARGAGAVFTVRLPLAAGSDAGANGQAMNVAEGQQ